MFFLSCTFPSHLMISYLFTAECLSSLSGLCSCSYIYYQCLSSHHYSMQHMQHDSKSHKSTEGEESYFQMRLHICLIYTLLLQEQVSVRLRVCSHVLLGLLGPEQKIKWQHFLRVALAIKMADFRLGGILQKYANIRVQYIV